MTDTTDLDLEHSDGYHEPARPPASVRVAPGLAISEDRAAAAPDGGVAAGYPLAVEHALKAWNALPDEERNGERPFVMGFNEGWEAALNAPYDHTDAVARRMGAKFVPRIAALEARPAAKPVGYLQTHPDGHRDFEKLALTPGDFAAGWTEIPLYTHPAPPAPDEAMVERQKIVDWLRSHPNAANLDWAAHAISRADHRAVWRK